MPTDEGQLNAMDKLKTYQSHSDISQREHTSGTKVAQQDNPPPLIPWSHDEKVRFWDALKYLDLVKAHFKDQPAVYSRFLDILSEYKRGIVDAVSVVDLISALFHGHPELVNGFHTFLLPEYSLAKALSERNAVDVREAFEYLNLVKVQLEDKPETYGQFLQAMSEYIRGTIDASGVVDFVSALLPLLHTELIAGLNKFIPVGYCVKDSHERSKL